MATAARSRGEALRDLGRRAAETAQARVPGASAVVESFERERAAGAGLLAGGVAYRLFLWLVPFGLVVAGVASIWVEANPGGLESGARRFGLTGAAAAGARSAVESGGHSRWYLLGAGLVLMLWFGVGAVQALRVAHQIAWAERAPKLASPARASLAFSGLVIGASAIGIGTRSVQHAAGGRAGLGATLGMSIVYLAVAATAMKLLPHRGAPLRALVPGALLATLGMQCVHVLVVLYLAPKLQRSPALYGSLGAATVLLLWLYITARLVVSAAFLNATLWDRKTRGMSPPAGSPRALGSARATGVGR